MAFLTPFLVTFSLIVWGIASERILTSGLMAALFLGLSLWPHKWPFTAGQKRRVNEFSLLMIILGVIFFVNIRQSLPMSLGLYLVSVTPYFLYPILLMRAFGEKKLTSSPDSVSKPSLTPKNPRDGAAWAKSWAEHARGGISHIDQRYPIDFQITFLLICSFSASTLSKPYVGLLINFVTLLSVILIRASEVTQRQTRFIKRAVVTMGCMFLVSGVVAVFGGAAINSAFKQFDAQILDWWSSKKGGSWNNRIVNTGIGKSGRVNLTNRLELRVEWDRQGGYLRNASYPFTTDGVQWSVGLDNDKDRYIFPSAENTFILAPLDENGVRQGATPHQQVKISTTINTERYAIPLPVGATDLFGLPLSKLTANRFNEMSISNATGFVKFGALYDDTKDLSPPPFHADLPVPADLRDPLDRLVQQAQSEGYELFGIPPDQVTANLKAFFTKHWHYTLELNQPNGKPRTLKDFMFVDRQGHCEYFAATTSLLLRRVGIPTRYTTGFRVSHFDQGEGLFWVRESDAHAWVNYWNGEKWVLLDTTVAGEMDPLDMGDQIADFFSRMQYAIDQFDSAALVEKLGGSLLYPLLAIAALYIAFKLYISKRLAQQQAKTPLSQQLIEALELWCDLKRRPDETAGDFWRRCAPLTPIETLILKAAADRDSALFLPPDRASKEDQVSIKAALDALKKIKKPKKEEASSH